MKNCRLYANLNEVLRHCAGGAKFVDSFYMLSSWTDLNERFLAMHLPNVGVFPEPRSNRVSRQQSISGF